MPNRFILLYYSAFICKSLCFHKDSPNDLAFTTETLISESLTEPTSALPTVVQTTTTAPSISCWYDTSTEPYHSNSAASLECLCGDTCITGVINGSHGVGYFWQCGCEMGGQTPYYLCPTNTQFDKYVCCNGNLCNAGNWTEQTTTALTTTSIQTPSTSPSFISCWYDTNTQPYHSASAVKLECLCGDTCIIGYINRGFGVGYFWQCGCELGGQTPYYLCPTNTQFDEYVCCKGDSCNTGNWTGSTTALTTTTLTTTAIQIPSTSPPFISCWYDGSFEPYHSNSAVALQCLCGDTCITGVINGSSGVGYFWQCGCELGSKEYHLCPTNNQYNEYVCCKGNLCNAGNWTDPMTTTTIDATAGTTNSTTSTSTTTQPTTTSSISHSTNPSTTTKATTVTTTTTSSTTTTTSTTPTTSSKQSISLFVVLTTVIWCFLSDIP